MNFRQVDLDETGQVGKIPARFVRDTNAVFQIQWLQLGTTGWQVTDSFIGDTGIWEIQSDEFGTLTEEVLHTEIRDTTTTSQVYLNKIVTMMTGQK